MTPYIGFVWSTLAYMCTHTHLGISHWSMLKTPRFVIGFLCLEGGRGKVYSRSQETLGDIIHTSAQPVRLKSVIDDEMTLKI